MSVARRHFGGNQEVLLHAEGFHFLLSHTVVTLHTTEVLFGVPSAECLAVIDGNAVARTQDRRFVHANAKDWWALTMSGLAFLEMGQMEPVEWAPYFHGKLCPTAREVIGARKRWGIVASPSATHLHPVSAYGAVLVAFPEVFGPQGIYYTHMAQALRENVAYLPDGDVRDAANARVDQLMGEIRSMILDNPQLMFHEYVAWLMRRVMRTPGEDSELTDTVTMFLVSHAGEEMYALLNCFLRDYELMVRLYNQAISSDVCMKQLEAAAGELPYVVHHPANGASGGLWWIKEALSITPHAVVVGERSIPYTGEIRTHTELITVLRGVFDDHFAIIPKAVCFLAQMLHVATFVNPDECHYERLVKELIRSMHQAEIEYTVVESTHGRWQQVMHALRAFGDQELVLPREMALAFGRERMTGVHLHQVLVGGDEAKLGMRLNTLLTACAEADRKQDGHTVMLLLEESGYLPSGTTNEYVRLVQQCDVAGRVYLAVQQETIAAFNREQGELFWRFIDGLPLESRERNLVLRNLFLSGRLDDMIHPRADVTALLDEIKTIKQVDRNDPRVDELLERLLQVVRTGELFCQDTYALLNKGRISMKGAECIFGSTTTPSEWFLTLMAEYEEAAARFIREKKEAEQRHRTLVRDMNARAQQKIEAAQVVRAMILKALHSLKLVDYYIGPVIGWVLGGDAYIQRIREQIHVVDHPTAPRL